MFKLLIANKINKINLYIDIYKNYYSIKQLVIKLLLKIIGIAIGATLFPITVILHFKGFRRVNIFTDRIGHLAIEPDCLLKEEALGKTRKRRWILLAPPNRVSNEHLLTYWDPYFYIVRNKILCFFINNMSNYKLMNYDVGKYIRNIGGPQSAYGVYREWGDREPILKLTEEDQLWGNQMLSQIGVPKGAWYVCVHARDGGYSTIDEQIHKHRNSNIRHTIPAIKEIVKKGGWVIRIGDKSMPPLPKLANVIDYAKMNVKTSRLDIILCAKARFIIGNTSGINLVGTIFGVPCALTNMIPMSAIGMHKNDISIFKYHWSVKEDRYLKLKEVLATNISRFQYSIMFDKEKIILHENTPDDIKELTIEMINLLEKKYDKKIIKLNSAIPRLFKKRHYSFGSASMISYRILKKNKTL
jgi:putative glycosyltransferase (TIGR04372 family)